VVRCASVQQQPTEQDYANLVRMAQYINFRKYTGLRYTPSDLQLRGSTDASFAVFKDFKSHTGALLWFGSVNSPVHITSKKQTLVTRSSAESEIVALSSIVEEILWFRWILAELDLDQQIISIQQDNQSVIQLQNAGPERNVKRGRYIDIKFFHVHDLIKDNVVQLVYTESETILADGFSKGLLGAHFQRWISLVTNQTLPPSKKVKH
jgi:hypothetical protein